MAQPAMETNVTLAEAIIRLSQEIYAFSDRPDYWTPETIFKARQAIVRDTLITMKELESYTPEAD